MIRYAAWFLVAALFAPVVLAPGARAGDSGPRHGLALYGDLKYGPDFTQFAYVDANAPKGGTFHTATVGSFDNLNPFILKGVPAVLATFPFETLLEGSADEPDSSYGLLAKSVELAPDRSWVRFVLRPEARWHDGTPITGEDVVFSYNTLITDGHPGYRISLAGIDRVELEAPDTVTFHLSDLENRKLPLIVSGLPIFSKAYYTTIDFTKTTLDAPLGSGPYRVGKVDPGRSITYERVADYWGAGLPNAVGRYNFDQIVIDYYRDRTVLVEALKSGEYDYHEEFTSKTWATAYDIDAISDGALIKEVLKDNTPSGVQAYFINTRLAKFQDRRLRQALAYAFDFEWMNKNLFYGLYDRMASYFENSVMAARGLPGEDELAFLEPLRDQIPTEVFTEEFKPPVTDGSGKNRLNLRAAKKLLAEAGWTTVDGKLVHGVTGETLSIEFLYFEPSFERVIAPLARNLERLGVEAQLRLVDQTQYIRRIQEHDFDITTRRFVQQLSPGAELRSYFNSAEADQIGSQNASGIKDPAVDALIEQVLAADDRPTMEAAARALDRVLLWGHYMIPQWFKGEHHLVYWNKFGRPAIKPSFSIGEADTWWIDAEKDAKLTAYRKALN